MRSSQFRPFSALMRAGLRVYQLTLSPVFYMLGVRCRHQPTCSSYGRDCIEKQGAWRGFWLTLGRLARCRPGGTQGFDPAPELRKDVKWWQINRFRLAFKEARNASNSPSGQQDLEEQ